MTPPKRHTHHHHHHHGPRPQTQPPPPYQAYPAHLNPPPPAQYAYVPTPVVMPMPVYQPPAPVQPEAGPTYVTNYIYQSPEPAPTPVQVVQQNPVPPYQDPIDWKLSSPPNASQLSGQAVVAGKDIGWNGSPLWVIRAHHNGNLVPGKLAVNERRAYIPIAGQEVPVHNFEVLCAPAHTVRWQAASNGQVPAGAIVAGNTQTAEPLYVGRARHRGSVTPGKVHPSHGCMYMSFGGVEVPHKTYEVLCRV